MMHTAIPPCHIICPGVKHSTTLDGIYLISVVLGHHFRLLSHQHELSDVPIIILLTYYVNRRLDNFFSLYILSLLPIEPVVQ